MTYTVVIERDDMHPAVVLFDSQSEGLLFAERYNSMSELVWPSNFHQYARTPQEPHGAMEALKLLEAEIIDEQGESAI